MNKKKIIFAICCHVDLCGAALSMLTALKGLQEHKYKVIIFIPQHGRIEEKIRCIGIEYHIIPMNLIATMNKPKFKIRLLQRLYDILFYMKHEIISIACLMKFVKKYPFRPSIVYTNTILPTAGMFLSRYYKVPHIVHVRELGDDDFHFKYYIGKRLALKILNRNTKYAICISKIVQTKWNSCFHGKTCVIYNGVNVTNKRKDSHKIDKIIKLLFVGRLSQEKGIMDILRAMKMIKVDDQFPKFLLDIYGEGIDKEAISQYIQENGLKKNITLKGYYDMSAIPMYNYDMAIMSSHNEAFGRVTIEYMMSGLPVIAYNGGATSEIIENNTSGLTYSTIPEMVSCIKRLIEDEKLRSKISENGRREALARFSEKQYISNINLFFDRL